MLRTIFVLSIIAFGFAQSWRGPFYALLFYLWLAYFRPEAWVWYNFVTNLNLSLIVGSFVVVRTVMSRERLRFGFGQLLILLFAVQSFISTINSTQFDFAWMYFTDFAKAAVMCVMIVTLASTEARLRLTFLVIAVSLGFESAKQGWAQFFLNPGGQNNNPLFMLGDNNGVAVGMFMLVPILLALARTASTRFEKLGHRFVAVGIVYRGISTYSRGGFLSAAVLALYYVLRSKRKVASLAGAALVVALIAPVLPEAFWTRMSTIQDASEDIDNADASARGRVHFWQVAVVMANDKPLTGVGHNAYNLFYDTYDFSNGAFKSTRSVHSAWFGVLAELGYPGLILFLLIYAYSFWQCWQVSRLAKTRPELKNLAIYATALEAGMVASVVGGTFVIFQYNEMLWHFFALSIAVSTIAREHPAVTTSAPVTSAYSAPEPRAVAMIATSPIGYRPQTS